MLAVPLPELPIRTAKDLVRCAGEIHADRWDLNALEKLRPADQIDYITDRLAADFKNKTPNVGTAILMLRNVAEELREVPTS